MCLLFCGGQATFFLGLTGGTAGDVPAASMKAVMWQRRRLLPGWWPFPFPASPLGGVSLGRILMVLMVLTCARLGGSWRRGGGPGITAGAIQGLSTAGLSYLSGAYGLGGLMAGVFSPDGEGRWRVWRSSSAHGIASMQVGADVRGDHPARSH